MQLDASLSWPPPDPDRMSRAPAQHEGYRESENSSDEISDQEWYDAFRRRQQEDHKRHELEKTDIVRRRKFTSHNAEICPPDTFSELQSSGSEDPKYDGQGWRDLEGDRLDDFGVDEDIDYYDEDEIPLAELRRKNKVKAAQE